MRIGGGDRFRRVCRLVRLGGGWGLVWVGCACARLVTCILGDSLCWLLWVIYGGYRILSTTRNHYLVFMLMK